MKFTVGQFVGWFVIFWVLGLGNWWLFTASWDDINRAGGIVIAIDIVVCIFGLGWILTRKFWDTEINLDKIKKNDDKRKN